MTERKTPDSLSSDLVNGDHLSIPGMHDYSYGSLGTYNQMSPSPKSVAPQSPSSVPRSYTLGKVEMKSAHGPSILSGWSLSQFLYHEATRSISKSPLNGILVHHRVTPNIKFAGNHLNTWV